LIGEHGLCAAVYTQIADWGEEVNGWLTYDRVVSKIDETKLKAWHESLYRTPPPARMILPPSMNSPQAWKYTLDKPADGWNTGTYDDAKWSGGRGPFGNGPYGNTGFDWPAVGTPWATNEIYLRKTFQLKAVPARVALRVYGLGTCDVYLNGRLVRSVASRDREGQIYACDVLLVQSGAEVLRQGENVIAVRCNAAFPAPPARVAAARPVPTARFVDVGLVEPVD
jgi:hypothetical protein